MKLRQTTQGMPGREFEFFGEPLVLTFTRRDLIAARAGGGLEDLLRTKAAEIHFWADKRTEREREWDDLAWQLFADYPDSPRAAGDTRFEPGFR